MQKFVQIWQHDKSSRDKNYLTQIPDTNSLTKIPEKNSLTKIPDKNSPRPKFRTKIH